MYYRRSSKLLLQGECLLMSLWPSRMIKRIEPIFSLAALLFRVLLTISAAQAAGTGAGGGALGEDGGQGGEGAEVQDKDQADVRAWGHHFRQAAEEHGGSKL